MIHPTAIVDSAASIDSTVTVGPYATIEGGVRMARGGRVDAGAHIVGDVTFGENCSIGHSAVIGAPPQDLGFNPETPSSVTIGSNCTFREFMTVHRSASDGGSTVIGDQNYFMVGSHVGHDCVVGNSNVLANAVLVAGHVTIGDSCFLGGGAGIHQFLRIGSLCMVKGNAQISQDVPPSTVAHGKNILSGLNVIGLRRSGCPPTQRAELKRLYSLLFRSRFNLSAAITEASAQQWGAAASQLLEFVASPSKKGLCSHRQ